jgi:hypothetical protein
MSRLITDQAKAKRIANIEARLAADDGRRIGVL